MENKKGRTYPMKGKCAQTVGDQRMCPYSMWCSTYPSVIRVWIYEVIIPFGAETVNSQKAGFFAILLCFHVYLAKQGRMNADFFRKWGSYAAAPTNSAYHTAQQLSIKM